MIASTDTYRVPRRPSRWEKQGFSGPVAGDYQTAWEGLATVITAKSVTEFAGVQTGGSSFNCLSVIFDLGAASSIWFDFGLDAGWGYEAYVNEVSVVQSSSDTWWAGNFANAFSVNIDPLVGETELELYWAEGCCNGGQSIRFSADQGASYSALSASNLDSAAVPVPSVLALLGTSLMLIGVRRRG